MLEGGAFVPCTRSRRSRRGIRVQRAAGLCWDGLRGERIPPAPALRCRQKGCGSLVAPPAAGMSWGRVPHVPSPPPPGGRPAEGAPAVPPGGDRESDRVPPAPCHGHPRPGRAHPGAGLGTGTLPQRGARVRPARTGPSCAPAAPAGDSGVAQSGFRVERGVQVSPRGSGSCGVGAAVPGAVRPGRAGLGCAGTLGPGRAGQGCAGTLGPDWLPAAPGARVGTEETRPPPPGPLRGHASVPSRACHGARCRRRCPQGGRGGHESFPSSPAASPGATCGCLAPRGAGTRALSLSPPA